MSDALITPPADQQGMVNFAEELERRYPIVDCPLQHTFTDGLYSRSIFMPAGVAVVSHKHRTRHQYVILQGKLEVWIPDKGWERLEAPYLGITEPGTQRILKIYEDTIWTTFHATDETDVDQIETWLIEPCPPHTLPPMRETNQLEEIKS